MYRPVEYFCEHCRLRFESFVDSPGPKWLECSTCERPAERVISAPLAKRFVVTVDRGRPAETPYPTAMDTQKLADGMKQSEWRAQRKRLRDERRRARIRRMVS